MPWTDRGKRILMTEGLDHAPRYVTLHDAEGAQLARANGYAPKAVQPADMAVADDGTVTLPATLEVYTADGDDAVEAFQAGLAEDAAGATPLLTPGAIADTAENPRPPAPADGETLRLSITITP